LIHQGLVALGKIPQARGIAIFFTGGADLALQTVEVFAASSRQRGFWYSTQAMRVQAASALFSVPRLQLLQPSKNARQSSAMMSRQLF
jgi:hypothetical protein